MQSIKVARNIVVGLAITGVACYFACISGTYGLVGLRAAVEEHLAWSGAGLIYWGLLVIAMLCIALAIATWFLLFHEKSRADRR